MSPSKKPIAGVLTLAALCLYLTAASGCAGGTADLGIRVPEKERPDLDATTPAEGKRRIPAEEPFNLVKFTSWKEGESAEGSSAGRGAGNAVCQSDVTGPGAAWGAFQLGYTFDNMTGRKLASTVHVHVVVKGTAVTSSNAADAADVPTGTGTVDFTLKDTLGVTVYHENLHALSLFSGPKESQGEWNIDFETTFEPGRGYYFVIAGKAEATCKPGQTARLDVSASNVSFNIAWRSNSPTTAPGATNPTPP